MRRTGFLHIPLWPIARQWGRRGWPEGRPVGLIATCGGAQRLMAVDGLAASQGLAAGQTLADARAIAPDLICAPYAPQDDARALAQLARWCGRFSPAVTPVSPSAQEDSCGHGIFLETAGVAHLFGGEEGLLRDVLARLKGFGLEVRGAIADTPGLAWGLACYAPAAARGVVAPVGAGLAAIAGLPAAALRLTPNVAARLRDLGLKRVGDLAGLPRASLARRFGAGLLAQMDAASGQGPEALAVLQPAPAASAHTLLVEPIVTLEAVQAVGVRLCGQVCHDLTTLGLGARGMRLRLFLVDGRVVDVAAGAQAAGRDPARWLRLLRERLARAEGRLDLGFGADAARVNAEGLEALAEAPAGALCADAAQTSLAHAAIADLSERLAVRLGRRAVVRLAPRASHWPERAQRAQSAGRAPTPAWPDGPRRPPFLLATPEPIAALAGLPDGAPGQFRWRRVLHRVARADGPERIAAEWWRADGPTRDYYTVETSEGRRYWLFRLGLYERETAKPGWFLHGAWS